MTTNQTADSPAVLGFSNFARHLGVKPGYITQLRKDDRLVLTDDGKRVRVAESIARIETTRDPSKTAVTEHHAAERARKRAPATLPASEPADSTDPASTPAEKVGTTYQAARAVKERYLAMAAKRDYELSMQELLRTAEVRAAITGAVTTLRTSLESLPDSIAPVLAAEADEHRVRVLLAEEIEVLLSNLAAAFDRIAAEDGP